MTQYREPLFLLGHARLLGWKNNKGGYKNITVYFELWPINEKFLSGRECKAFSVIVYHVVDEFKMDRYFSKLAWKFQSLYQSNLLGRGVCCVKITKDTLLSVSLSIYEYNWVYSGNCQQSVENTVKVHPMESNSAPRIETSDVRRHPYKPSASSDYRLLSLQRSLLTSPNF